MKIAIATNNPHKVQEILMYLQPLGMEIATPQSLGIRDFSPNEVGTTFPENAKIKALALFQKTGIPSLADDSGLVIPALGNEPGVYSARYGGENLTDKERCHLILEKLSFTNNREAYFVCCLCYIDEKGKENLFEDTVYGVIGKEYRKGREFGYDPIFYYPPLGKYFSELTEEEKNSISHRGKALQKFTNFLGSKLLNTKC